ncbi:MAG: hypothetical protein ACE5D6_05990 [Candidatus Zixiibacteriota bacterium]
MKYLPKAAIILLISFSFFVSFAMAKNKENDSLEKQKASQSSEIRDKLVKRKAASPLKTDSKTEAGTSGNTRTKQQLSTGNNKDESTSRNLTSPLTGEEINWQVIAGGGNYGSSTNYFLGSTVGQTAVGYGISSTYNLSSGFWYELGSPSCCVGITGNIDGSSDDLIDIGDIVYFIDYSFSLPSGPEPPCMEEADVNGDIVIDIEDIVYLIDYSFSLPAGPTPVDCL